MSGSVDPVAVGGGVARRKVRGGLRLSRAGVMGALILAVIGLPCFLTLPWSVGLYDAQSYEDGASLASPSMQYLMGTDQLGRPLLWRCLLGGAISLGIGLSAAVISVGIGVAWGATSGYLGGRVDSVMMRIVDVLYGLPYILLVVLLNIALHPILAGVVGRVFASDVAGAVADVLTLLLAIGSVSWLTMARVIRGQVLSLREQPYVEAARACGVGVVGVMVRHLLPNLIGPIIVYTTLTVPMAILQESFLSFLGIGVQAPLPSWGNLAADGLKELHNLAWGIGSVRWWLVFWPCFLLGLTLMALNFLGDALRDALDPKTRVKR